MSGHERSVAEYSDIALQGAIKSLSRMRNRDEWGDDRLDALKAEQEHRAAQAAEQDRISEEP